MTTANDVKLQSGRLCDFVSATLDRNGLRYQALVFKMEQLPDEMGTLGALDGNAGFICVCCLNGRAHAFQRAGFIHYSYVREKFGLQDEDAHYFTDLLCVALNRPGLGSEEHQ